METRGLRVEGSRTVHRPSVSSDHRGEELPAVACHAGIAGWDARRLRYTTDAVNCRRAGCCQGAAEVVPNLTLF